MFSSKKIIFTNNKINCPSPSTPLCGQENDCVYVYSHYENGCPSAYGCGCSFNQICGPCVFWSSEPQDYSGGNEIILNYEYSTIGEILNTIWQKTDDDGLNWSSVDFSSNSSISVINNVNYVSGNITISNDNHVVGRKYRVLVNLKTNELENHVVWSRTATIELSPVPSNWTTTYLNSNDPPVFTDSSVSLNHDGDVFAIGNPSEDNNEGAVYIYKKAEDTWFNTTQNKLVPTGYVAKTTRYTVTSNSGKYYINGSFSPSLILNEGENYIFDLSDSSNTGHQLKFSTISDGSHNGGVSFSTGIEEFGVAGTSGSYVKITVLLDSPDLYYYCPNHSGMGNFISTRSVSHPNKLFGYSVKLNRKASSISDGTIVLIGEPGSNKAYSYFNQSSEWFWNQEIYDYDNSVNFGKDFALNDMGNFALIRSNTRIKMFYKDSAVWHSASPFLTASGDNVFIKNTGFPTPTSTNQYVGDFLLVDSLSKTLKTFSCQNPPISKDNVSTQNWQYNSSSFNLDNFAFPYYISMNYDCTRMVLSGQGRTRVYDRDGSNWVQFGQELEGDKSKMCYLGNRVVTYNDSLNHLVIYQRNLDSFDRIATIGQFTTNGSTIKINNYDFSGNGRTLILNSSNGIIMVNQNV